MSNRSSSVIANGGGSSFEQSLRKEFDKKTNLVGDYLQHLEEDDPEMLEYFLTEAK